MSRTKRQIPARIYMRSPRTKQEIAANHAAQVDGMPVRSTRKGKKPPTSWDDINISASYETDFKRRKP